MRAGTFRRAAQPDGAAMVQTRLDPHRARTGGTQHLCARFQPRAAVAVLAMAAYGRRGLEPRKSSGPVGDIRLVLLRLAAAGGLHINDRLLRPVRAAAGLALPSWTPAVPDQFQDGGAVPAHSPSDLSELADHLLGDASNDRGPSDLGAGDDGLHLPGHPIRRAGSDPVFWGRLPAASRTGVDDLLTATPEA